MSLSLTRRSGRNRPIFGEGGVDAPDGDGAVGSSVKRMNVPAESDAGLSRTTEFAPGIALVFAATLPVPVAGARLDDWLAGCGLVEARVSCCGFAGVPLSCCDGDVEEPCDDGVFDAAEACDGCVLAMASWFDCRADGLSGPV